MKTLKYIFGFLLALNYTISNAQNFNYQRTYATYFGDEYLFIKANAIDSQGNIYVVGRAEASNPNTLNITTPGAHQQTYGGGPSDGFIAKFNPAGILIYATYFGGSDFDKIESATIDKDDNLYVVGMTKSEDNIASPTSLQTSLNGISDAFLAKFSPAGVVIWSTYYGGAGYDGSNAANSDETNIYCGIASDNGSGIYFFTSCGSQDMGTPGTFQPERQPTSRYLISKFTNDGQKVWATYYGFNNAEVRAITCTNDALYIAGHSFDCPLPTNNFTPNTYFSTPGAHQTTAGSCTDAFLTKFSATGSRIWSTYYGGAGSERLTSESIKCSRDYVALAGYTGSGSGIATSDAYLPGPLQNPGNFLVKFNINGVRQWGTYCGDVTSNGGGDYLTFLNIDEADNLYLSGRTLNTQYIATSDSFKPTNSGNDAFVVKFSPTGERIWGTYYGGISPDLALKTLVFGTSFYIIGDTSSHDNITTPNAAQPNLLLTGSESNYINNIYIAKFDPIELTTSQNKKDSFAIYPNPNNGSFQISLNNLNKNYKLEIYDTFGHLLQKQNVKSNEKIQTKNLSAGIYFVHIISDRVNFKTEKIIIK